MLKTDLFIWILSLKKKLSVIFYYIFSFITNPFIYFFLLLSFIHLCVLSIFHRPYDGKWSKSMVGYGPEDNYFVVELTYNYGIDSYKLGNDFRVSISLLLHE